MLFVKGAGLGIVTKLRSALRKCSAAHPSNLVDRPKVARMGRGTTVTPHSTLRLLLSDRQVMRGRGYPRDGVV